MNTKKLFAVFAVVTMCFASAVLCASESSAVGHDEASMSNAIFSRATVTYLEDVTYAEHKDRSDCWFFIDDSPNESIFIKYVTRQSDTVPSKDDRDELNKMLETNPNVLCNIYNLGIKAKFTVNAPLSIIDYVHVNVKAGQRLSVNMRCDCGKYFTIVDSTSSETSLWLYDRQYMTTPDKDVEYSIFPQNEALQGGNIDIKDMFVTVSYDVSVSSGAESNGSSIVIAVVLIIISAAVIAGIVLCSRKISWAKGAAVPAPLPEEPGDEIKENKK